MSAPEQYTCRSRGRARRHSLKRGAAPVAPPPVSARDEVFPRRAQTVFRSERSLNSLNAEHCFLNTSRWRPPKSSEKRAPDDLQSSRESGHRLSTRANPAATTRASEISCNSSKRTSPFPIISDGAPGAVRSSPPAPSAGAPWPTRGTGVTGSLLKGVPSTVFANFRVRLEL